MNLLLIGSVNQYTKGLARQTQWKLKKQSGDLTGHKKSLQDYVTFTKASDLLPDTDEKDDKLSGIVTKAQAGKKLSPDEWEYIRVKAPELYAKLREVEKEAEGYEEALRRCKTRDEAQRLHMSKLGEIMTAAKNGDSGALFRLNRMTQTMTAFTESREYHDLPTEAEQAIERESKRLAQQEALREEAEIKKAEKEAESETETDAEDETASETGDAAEDGSASEAKDAVKVPSRTEAASENALHTPGARHAVPRASGQTARPEPTGKSASPNGDSAPAMPLGHRAYLSQQRGESRDHPRRRVDAEA